MHRSIYGVAVVVAVLASLFADGVAAQESGAVPPGLSPTVNNPYFPLPAGRSRVYEGQEVDPDTGETIDTRVHERDVPTGSEVNGIPVTEIAVREYKDGQLIEATSDYHAQGADGTVYYLGEDVDMYENGQVVSHEGTWLAGEGENQAGVFLPAEPRVGQRFQQERAPGVAEDTSTVIASDLTVTTPAGTFSGCIKTQDLNPLDQSLEYKYYCPGVGLVREESASGHAELVSYTGG